MSRIIESSISVVAWDWKEGSILNKFGPDTIMAERIITVEAYDTFEEQRRAIIHYHADLKSDGLLTWSIEKLSNVGEFEIEDHRPVTTKVWNYGLRITKVARSQD